MPIKFRILGSGEWGLAIGNHLSWNNYDVEILIMMVTKFTIL